MVKSRCVHRTVRRASASRCPNCLDGSAAEAEDVAEEEPTATMAEEVEAVEAVER